MSSGRPVWIWLVPLILLALAAVEALLLPSWRRESSPAGAAKWIWSEDHGARDGWVAFLAVRDFELEARPKSAALRISADTEFWASLNGEAIGAARFRRGVLREYQVAPWLRAGKNRLTVEVRSNRGVGGLLVRLMMPEAGDGEIVSDESFRVVHAYRTELAKPEQPLELANTAPMRVWGAPPTGRWGRISAVEPTPTLEEVVADRKPAVPQRVRVGDPAGDWGEFRFDASRGRANPIGHWVTFDFGARRRGYVNLVFKGRQVVEGLLFADRKIPDPRVDRPATEIIKLSGLRGWTDSTPRTFRYLTVLTLEPVVGARVYLLSRNATGVEVAPPGSNEPQRGAFGLRPARQGSSVEDDFWREFDRIHRATAN